MCSEVVGLGHILSWAEGVGVNVFSVISVSDCSRCWAVVRQAVVSVLVF